MCPHWIPLPYQQPSLPFLQKTVSGKTWMFLWKCTRKWGTITHGSKVTEKLQTHFLTNIRSSRGRHGTWDLIWDRKVSTTELYPKSQIWYLSTAVLKHNSSYCSPKLSIFLQMRRLVECGGTCLNLAQGRQRKVNSFRFKTCLVYTACSGTARAI